MVEIFKTEEEFFARLEEFYTFPSDVIHIVFPKSLGPEVLEVCTGEVERALRGYPGTIFITTDELEVHHYHPRMMEDMRKQLQDLEAEVSHLRQKLEKKGGS